MTRHLILIDLCTIIGISSALDRDFPFSSLDLIWLALNKTFNALDIFLGLVNLGAWLFLLL